MKVLALFAILALASAGTLPKRKQLQYKRILYPHLADAQPALKGTDYSKIVGGEEATPGQFPHAAFLTFFRGGVPLYYCTGSLISNKTVVTAGHCTEDGLEDNVHVLLGAHNQRNHSEPDQLLVIATDRVTHENWTSSTVDNDIGLVNFDSAVDFTSKIQPIALATQEPAVGEDVSMAGWGKTGVIGGVSDVLMWTTDPVADDSEASDYYGGSLDFSTKICIHYNSSGTCSGDSGGPLMYNSKLVGITSFGSSAGCQSGAPDCFTSVMYYLDWIADNQA